ncbi:MAG: methylated-DNA--[protein]-cysteine S-methyltransferase [Myxococcales bacterium]|nr:methylated-DNA--[protein]-cysteine S-methyltransferase [Myxococcales bacterium]
MARREEVFRYAVVDSPVGPLTVVEGERGVVAVDFGAASATTLASRLGRDLRRVVLLERRSRLRATTELGEYFRGRRTTFGVPLDWRLVSGFQRRVLERLARVRFGQLTTYGALAQVVGSPGAARAVGAAMAKNPLPILVPCHRVVAADGSLGGFSGGIELKRRLHQHEGLGKLSGGWSTKSERQRNGAGRVGRSGSNLASSA